MVTALGSWNEMASVLLLCFIPTLPPVLQLSIAAGKGRTVEQIWAQKNRGLIRLLDYAHARTHGFCLSRV